MKSLTNFENLTKALLKFPSIWLVYVLQCRPLIGCRENAQVIICHRRLPVWFYIITGGFLNALSVSKLPVISKEEGKTLSLIFSSIRIQKIAKIIRAFTHSTRLILLAFQKIFISWHNLFKGIAPQGSYIYFCKLLCIYFGNIRR
jgi:hypothetical protein